VLLMAANTSYNDFPWVLFLMAPDRQAPRSFLHIGDRLTFRNGILLLSVAAAAVYIGFGGKTGTLLPLYAVGVFLAFTLSQTGMIMHWRHHRDQPHWRRSLAFNAIGALLSGIVFVVADVTKFTSGAWVSIVLIGGIVVICLRIHRYYDVAGQQPALRPGKPLRQPHCLRRSLHGRISARLPHPVARAVARRTRRPGPPRPRPDPRAHRCSRSWLWTGPPSARSRMPPHSAWPAFALHISPTPVEADRFLGYWQARGDHLSLEAIVSPHRAVVALLVNYSGRCTGSART
jgi:hypothetical protein